MSAAIGGWRFCLSTLLALGIFAHHHAATCRAVSLGDRRWLVGIGRHAVGRFVSELDFESQLLGARGDELVIIGPLYFHKVVSERVA